LYGVKNIAGTNNDKYVIGVDIWAWSDNNWVHSSYHEIRNFGLVTSRDNAYEGVEAKSAVGTDSYGFAIGGEPFDCGNYITKVKEANALLLSNFLGV
jgi:hypothetical protein